MATTTAAALFLGVVAIRVWLPGEEAVTALFVFPISLVATARGLRGRPGGRRGRLAPDRTRSRITDANLSVTGWLVRIVTLLAVGALLGRASDNLARAEQQRRLNELAAQRQRQAVEINDTLVQWMSAAKWAFEAGRAESGLATLTDTIVLGQDLVSELIRQNEPAGRLVTRD